MNRFVFERWEHLWEAHSDLAGQFADLDLVEWSHLPAQCRPQDLFEVDVLPPLLPDHAEPQPRLGGPFQAAPGGDATHFVESGGLLVAANFMYRSRRCVNGPFLASQERAFGLFGPDTLAADVIRAWGLPNRVEWRPAWPPGPPDPRPAHLVYLGSGWCVEFHFERGALVILTASVPPHCGHGHTHYPGLGYSSRDNAFDY